MSMAESPRMVMTLKGSTTLRVASHAFSRGVSGLTCGPLVKRTYQLGGGGQGGFVPRVESGEGLAADSAGALAPSAFDAGGGLDVDALAGQGAGVAGWTALACG